MIGGVVRPWNVQIEWVEVGPRCWETKMREWDTVQPVAQTADRISKPTWQDPGDRSACSVQHYGCF